MLELELHQSVMLVDGNDAPETPNVQFNSFIVDFQFLSNLIGVESRFNIIKLEWTRTRILILELC